MVLFQTTYEPHFIVVIAAVIAAILGIYALSNLLYNNEKTGNDALKDYEAGIAAHHEKALRLWREVKVLVPATIADYLVNYTPKLTVTDFGLLAEVAQKDGAKEDVIAAIRAAQAKLYGNYESVQRPPQTAA